MEDTPDFAAIQASSRHGSRARYKAGCRCDACRAANAAYQRTRREAGRIAPDPAADIAQTVGKWIGTTLRAGALAVLIVAFFRRASSKIS